LTVGPEDERGIFAAAKSGNAKERRIATAVSIK